MDRWLRLLALSAQTRAGLSADIVLWSATAALTSALAVIFLVIAAFVWLSDRYGIVIAGVTLGIFFLVLALISFFACALVRRRNIQRAERELEMRKAANANPLDGNLLAAGYQVGDAIGWHRLGPLLAVGLLAIGVAKEWNRPGGAKPEERDSGTAS